MARILIRQAHGGATHIISDVALPYFLNQGYVVLDTLDDQDDTPPLYLSRAEGDLRWAKISDLGDPESAEGQVLTAAFVPLEDRTVSPGLGGLSLGTWTPRDRVRVGSSQEIRAAQTGPTVDHVAHLFQTVAKGDWTVDTGPNPGYAWGTNFFTVTGTAPGDGNGLVHFYGGLIEADVAAPAGTTIQTVTGLQAEASFFGAASAATVTDMMSMFVAAPVRKDGATGGTVTNRVYGLYVAAVPAGDGGLGAAQAYSFYVAGGDSRIAGRLLTDGGQFIRKVAPGSVSVAPPYLDIWASTADNRLHVGDGDTGTDRIIATLHAAITTKASAYTATASDQVILASGTTTITLPSAVTAEAGRKYTVKNVGTAVITVASTAGTIDGAVSDSLPAQYQSKDFISDGTNWWVV